MTLPHFDPWADAKTQDRTPAPAKNANLLNEAAPISMISAISRGAPPGLKNFDLATVQIEMCIHGVAVGIWHSGGRIGSISVPPSTDPVRTKAAAIVNSWLAQGDDLETQAVRLLALTDLVAGLIRWKRTLTR
jgi:hypothetical protein